MTDAKELLSDDLVRQIEKAACAQNRKPSEVLEDAVKRYLEEQFWQAFVGKAEERNRAKGITEEDVPRMVSEVRQENEEHGR